MSYQSQDCAISLLILHFHYSKGLRDVLKTSISSFMNAE